MYILWKFCNYSLLSVQLLGVYPEEQCLANKQVQQALNDTFEYECKESE